MVNFFINLAAVVFKIELRNITFINCHDLLHLCYFLDLRQIVIAKSLGGGSYPHQIHLNTFAVSCLLRKYSYF